MKRLLFISLLLAACDPISLGLVGGMLSGGGYIGYQHSKAGGLEGVWKDKRLVKEVKKAWKEAGLDEPFLEIYSVCGNIIIMGASSTQENLERAKALAHLSQAPVHSIADTQIGRWNNSLVSSIKIRLIVDFDISSRNYHICAIGGRVWIVGVAKSQEEKIRIISKIQNISGVQNLKHHILVEKIN